MRTSRSRTRASTNLLSASVSITGFQLGDALTANTSGTSITADYNAFTGVLSLSGTDSLASYQAVLDSVAYGSTSLNPTDYSTDDSRTVNWLVNDGLNGSSPVASTIVVTPVDQAPVLSNASDTVDYTQGAAAIAADPNVAVSDPDNLTLQGARLAISEGLLAGDALNFTSQFGISGSYNGGSGVLTLTGSATLAQYQAALASITFSSSSINPTDYGTDDARTVSWTVSDAMLSSSPVTSTVDIIGVDQPPVLSGTGNTVAYDSSGSAVAVDAGLAVSDPDSLDLAGATVTISGGFAAGDTLNFADQNGLSGSYNASTGVLTLSGSATLAQYQAALVSVTFSSSSPNPTDYGADRTRTISWQASEGTKTSNVVTSTVDITGAFGPPVLDNAGNTVSYTQGGAAVPVDADLTLSDPSSATLIGATVSITGGFFAGDILNFATQRGISGSYNGGTGVLTLTGTATLTQYQAALASITFGSSSLNPTDYGSDDSRTVSWTASDGTFSSSPVFSAVDIIGVDQPPVLSNAGTGASYTSGGSEVTIDPALAVSDPDNLGLAGATVSITNGYVDGDTLEADTSGTNIAASYDAATGVLTLSGSDSFADYQSVLDSVTFSSSNSDPTDSGHDTSRTVTYIASDGTQLSSPLTTAVTVANPIEAIAVSDVVAPATLNQFAFASVGYHLDLEGLAGLTGAIEVTAYLSQDGRVDSTAQLVATDTISLAGLSGATSYDGQLQLSPAAFGNLPFGNYQVIVAAALSLASTSQQLTSSSASANVFFEPGYSAEITTPALTVVAGASATLSGTATSTTDGSAVAYAPVDVTITGGSFQETLTATTDATGNFSVDFQPLAGGEGTYDVSAYNPGLPPADRAAPQSAIDVVGLSFAQEQVRVTTGVGTGTSGTITIDNPSDEALGGITSTVSGLPQGWSFTLNDLPSSLAANSQTVVNYTLTTSSQSNLSTFALNVAAADGAQDTATFNVTSQLTGPDLQVNASGLTTDVLAGSQTLLTFTITNDGQEAADDVRLSLPQGLSWLQSAAPQNLGTIAGGGSLTVSLLADPATDVPLGEYQGTLAVQYGADSNQDPTTSVPFDLTVTTDQTGSVAITIEDEATILTSGAPLVQDATVTITDAAGAPVATYTGVNGTLQVPELTVGSYNLQISAANHSTYNQTIQVAAGQDNVDAFLPIQAATYSWSVVPSTVTDTYSIQLDSAFETNVPIPVITVNPPTLDFSSLGYGQSMVIDLTMTNQGLIAADDVTLDLPNPTGYVITPLVNSVPEIAADSSVEIPVSITRLLPSTAASSGTPAAGSQAASTGLEFTASQPIILSSIPGLTPLPFIDATDWGLIEDRLQTQLGDTTGSADRELAVATGMLQQIGQPASDASTVLAYEVEEASGLLPNITLADTTDIAESGTGLDLSLTRTYSASFLDRNNSGAFGDGWTYTFGIDATTDASGNVYITSAAGTEVFSAEAGGGYAAQAGDSSALTEVDGAFVLTDAGGTVERFRTDGQLSSITDANGNRITLSYDAAGVISGVTDSNGQSLAFTTNAEGRITSAVDQSGQTVTYTYDASGDHLLSVTTLSGTTSYSYSTDSNPLVQNALTQITNPDGTTQAFQYDSQGNLSEKSGPGGAGATTYSYGLTGTVTETDAAGNATTLVYDANGNLAEAIDASGNVTGFQYDGNGNLTGITSPGGGTDQFTYSADGNLQSYTDLNGGVVTATYAPGTDLLTSLTDQNGNTTQYSYDSAGDLTGITQADGTGTTYQYAADGALVSSTDALGRTTTYTYNAQGLLSQESFADGTFQAYTYNAFSELTSAQATNGGVTSYGYNAAGELTSVTDPQGLVESYAYNSAGQEVQRVEPDGSTTNYSYSVAGQLAELTDGSGNLITQYSYDALGQLTGSLDGNGQTTSYTYDALGNITQIQTLEANSNVTSQIEYTYDGDSRPITATSQDGTWSYSYDAEGELTHAVFASTNASIPNQDLNYTYDAAGNRTETIFNGAVTDYTTNNLNQYTSANGTTYSYDTDGNLVSTVQNGQTTTYTYNDQNQLVSEIGPDGTTTYQYDALGNLVSQTVNGVTSNYVIDPLAISTSATGPLSAIAQAYNAAGQVTATYDYGNGLAAETTSSGTDYYNIDATGNVMSLSGPGGALVNTYDYTPFGTLLASTGNVANPFQYSGVFGVTTGANGLINMRARYLDPSNGTFISPDPIGDIGGTNLYEYANGSPLYYVDPSGDFPWGEVFGFVKGQLISEGEEKVGENLVDGALYINGGFLVPSDIRDALESAAWHAVEFAGNLSAATTTAEAILAGDEGIATSAGFLLNAGSSIYFAVLGAPYAGAKIGSTITKHVLDANPAYVQWLSDNLPFLGKIGELEEKLTSLFSTGTDPTYCPTYSVTSGGVSYSLVCVGTEWKWTPIAYNAAYTEGAPCPPGAAGTWLSGTNDVGGPGVGGLSGPGGGGGPASAGATLYYVSNPVSAPTYIICDPNQIPIFNEFNTPEFRQGLALLQPIVTFGAGGLAAEISGGVGAIESLFNALGLANTEDQTIKNGGGDPTAAQSALDDAASATINLMGNAVNSLIGSTLWGEGSFSDILGANALSVLQDVVAGGAAQTLSDIEQALAPSFGTEFSGLSSVPQAAQILIDQIDFQNYLLGDSDIFNTTDGQGLANFLSAIASAFENDTPITDLPDVPVPAGVDPSVVSAIVGRVNQTLQYWGEGINDTTDVPTGQSQDFVPLDALTNLFERVAGPIDESDSALDQTLDGNQATVEAALQGANGIENEAVQTVTGVCATVTMQIQQSAVMSRSAFVGTLTLDPNIEMDGLSLNLVITDENGNVVDPSTFGISLTSLTGISALDGSQSVEPGDEVTAQYTFVPSLAAAANGPTEYNIGGTITSNGPSGNYTETLTPATVTVLPQPDLIIDYFEQRDVVGYDPTMPNLVTPPQPFVLGVQVQNVGAGDADNLQIESAQPTVVDNEKGLDIAFTILGSEVDGEPDGPSLDADFGTVGAGTTATGAWFLESSLQGKFVSFNASFQNVNPLGLNEDSIIQQVNIYDLIHAGDIAGDGAMDFLADVVPNSLSLPDTLFEANGTQVSVKDIDSTPDVIAEISDVIIVMVETPTKAAEWDYFDALVPADDSYSVTSVISANGTALLSGQYWFTDRTFTNTATEPVYEDRIHIVDDESSPFYVVTFTKNPAPGVDSITVGLTNDTGPSPVDDITFEDELSGTGAPNAIVSFNIDGTDVAATAAADSNGNWSFTPTGLTDGVHTIIASETDASGNTGTASLSFDLITTPPAVTEVLASGSGNATTGFTTTDPAITGTGEANAIVNFVIDGSPIAVTATADANGNWSFTPVGLADGVHTIVASETDLAGNTGIASLTFTLLPSTLAEAAVTSGTPVVLPDVRIGSADAVPLSIANATAPPAEGLDVSVAGVTGNAVASGSISLLAAGATDSSSIMVGVNTATAGDNSGTITLAPASDGQGFDGQGVTPLPNLQVAVSGSVYREAAPSVVAVPANLVVHVGDSVSQSLTIGNAAADDGYSENLRVAIAGTTGGITAPPPTGEIAPQATGALTFGFSTASAGQVSGTIVLDFASDGIGIDGYAATPDGAQTVQVSATVDNYAAAGLWASGIAAAGTNSFGGANYTVDLGTLSEGMTAPVIDLDALNTAAGPADLLAGSFTESGSSAFINALSSFSGGAAGRSDPVGTVSVSTAAAGSFAETITLSGTGSNASGYEAAVPDATLTIDATISPPPTTTVPGAEIVEAGADTVISGISVAEPGNGGAGFAVVLTDTFGALSANAGAPGGGGTITGSGTADLVISGSLSQVDADLSTVSYQANTAVSDTIQIATTDTNGGRNKQQIAVAVDNPATAVFQQLSGGGALTRTGNSYTLNLGTITQGATGPTVAFALDNAAIAPADLLAGSFSVAGNTSAFVNSGLGTFASLSAGARFGPIDVTLKTGTSGSFSETLTLAATGSNASGYSAALGTVTLSVEGTIAPPSGQVFTLTTGADTDVEPAGSSDNLVIATGGTLSSGDDIDPGTGGGNTLALQGAGVFNMTLPATLVDFSTVNAQEGQATYTHNGVTYLTQTQTVDLRSGLDAVIAVAPATVNPNNPNAPTITVVGATNDDSVINLASGNDAVTLGSAQETANGGGGNNTFYATSATIGATINGGNGTNILEVTGGGTMAMGANIKQVADVLLIAGTTAYDFTANSITGLLMNDAGTSTTDKLIAGGTNQTITGGGAGKLTMDAANQSGAILKDSATIFNRDTLKDLVNGDAIDVTGLAYSSTNTALGFAFNSSSDTTTMSVLLSGVQKTAITLLGQYMASDFSVGTDSAKTGTLITLDHELNLTMPH